MRQERTFDNGYEGTEEYPEYIDHYFYFPARSGALKMAERLRARGWSVKVLPAAVGAEWLALATQPATGDEDMGEIWVEFTALASRLGGNYDGWERPMDEPDVVN